MPGYSAIESSAGSRIASCQLHGVLVQVFGVGVILTGDSGVGKTSCAIELIRRGHALVADDAVQIYPRGIDLFGTAPEITRSLIYIRGSGIANATDLFGRASLLNECKIDIEIQIEGTDPRDPSIFLDVPFFRIEIGPPSVTADRVEEIVYNH